MAATFTCFQNLPPELRNMIWKLICSVPRNIDIRTFEIYDDDGSEGQDLAWTFETDCQTPVVLHVSHESRTEALKHYELKLGSQTMLFRKTTIATPPQIYINFEVDCFCPNKWLRSKPMEVLYNYPVQRIAINYHKVDFAVMWHFWNGAEWVDSLKEVILYNSDEEVVSPLEFQERDPKDISHSIEEEFFMEWETTVYTYFEDDDAHLEVVESWIQDHTKIEGKLLECLKEGKRHPRQVRYPVVRQMKLVED